MHTTVVVSERQAQLAELATAVADEYIGALRMSQSAACRTPAQEEQRRQRAEAIVLDVMRSLEREPREGSNSPRSNVAASLKIGLDPRVSIEATGTLFEVALPLLRDASPDDVRDQVAPNLVRRLLADISSVAGLFWDAVSSHPVSELVDQKRLEELLSAREAAVFNFIHAQACTRDIADSLGISVHTVKHHVTSIGRKLGTTGRRAVLARARELGILVAAPAMSLGSVSIDGVSSLGLV